MEIQLLSENVSKLSKQMSIIQEFISIKFGLDFKQFCQARNFNPVEVQNKEIQIVSTSTCSSSNINVDTATFTRRSRRSKRKCSKPNYKDSSNDDETVDAAELPNKDVEENLYGVKISQWKRIKMQNDDCGGGGVSEEFVESIKLKTNFDDLEAEEFGYEEDSLDINFEPTSQTDSEDSNFETEKRPLGPLKMRYDYNFKKSFESLTDAKESVRSEQQWRYRTITNSNGGRRMAYDCKKSRKCPAKLYLLIKSANQGVDLYSTDLDHANDEAHNRKTGLLPEVQHAVNDLLLNGINKPRFIINRIRDRGLPIPTRVQLTNYLQYQRFKKTVKASEPKPNG